MVAGAAGDLGSVIALRLAQDGFDITLNDLPARKPQLGQLKADIEALAPRKACITIADVTVENQVAAAVETASEALGGFEVVSILASA